MSEEATSRRPSPGPADLPGAERVSSAGFWRELRRDEPLFHPHSIGPYEIERVLGFGSYGVVYLARQERPRREVALKVLRPGVAGVEALKRFELEAHVLARLDHPGIARIFELGQADFGFGPQPYSVMEYVRGRPISAHAREAGLSLREKVELLIRLCEAVQHAHQRGVLHRDLSPSNVLVDEEGRPRVVDFGIARLTRADDSPVSLHTQPGQVLGTLPYASPEQVGGRPDDVDTRTDVYSLGALGYELLTTRPPHDLARLPLPEAARVIREEQPAPAGKLVPALAGDLETILAQALARERERRYASAAELGAELGRWLRNEPISARPASTLYQLGKLARRHRGLVAGLALAGLSLTAGLAGTIAGLIRARRAEAGLTRRAESAERELAFLMDYALGDIVPRIGSADLQRPLLEELRSRIEGQLQEDPHSALLRADLAQMLVALGMLEVSQDHDELALDLQRRALALREQLVAEFPRDVAVRRARSESLTKIGDLERRRGELHGALAWYLRTLEQDESLAEDCPENARVLDDLCWSYERVGVVQRDLGEFDAARELFTKRHALAEDLVRWDPEPRKARFNLCASHEQLAILAFEEGDSTAAVAHACEQVRLALELATEAPDDWHYARYLAGAYGTAARAEETAGNRAQAEEMMRGSVAVIRRLVEANPDDSELVAAATHYHAVVLAGFLRAETRRAEACSVLHELLELGERLERQAPGAIGPLRMQRRALSDLAEILGDEEASAQRAAQRRLHAQITAHPRAEADDHVLQARFLLASGTEGDVELAVQAAERACVASSQPCAQARVLLAQALIAGGRPEEALHALVACEDRPGGTPAVVEGLRETCRRALAESSVMPHGSDSRVLEEGGH